MNKPALPAPMDVRVSSLHFASIFEPNSHDNRYGVAVPWADLEASGEPLCNILAEPILKAKGSSWGLVNLRSNRKPRIYPGNGDPQDLIDLWAKADAMNIPRAALLTGRQAILHLCFWEKTRNYQNGSVGVSLNAITIDTTAIEFPGPLDELYTSED